MSDLASLLPPKLAEIAEVIGVDAALKLSAAHPGIRIHVPKQVPAQHDLCVVLGADAARMLCEVYGGADLVVPMASRAHREKLHQAILDALDAGSTAPDLARRFGVHQFTVYRLAADRRRKQAQHRASQPRLF